MYLNLVGWTGRSATLGLCHDPITDWGWQKVRAKMAQTRRNNQRLDEVATVHSNIWQWETCRANHGGSRDYDAMVKTNKHASTQRQAFYRAAR
jgi:hypothetical protein